MSRILNNKKDDMCSVVVCTRDNIPGEDSRRNAQLVLAHVALQCSDPEEALRTVLGALNLLETTDNTIE